MKPYEFTRFYHPSLGRFMYKHKGSGLIIDNIFDPRGRGIFESITKTLKNVASKLFKPIAKKALQSGQERLGKKIGEKSGDFIMRKLASRFGKQKIQKQPVLPTIKEESTDDILNHLISGSGF